MVQKNFSSITHLHIYAVTNTIIKYSFIPQQKKVIRILDVGCGTGLMLSTLTKHLTVAHTDLTFEFYGMDVDDSSIQEKGYFEKTIELLESTMPGKNWSNNLRLIKSTDQWPYPDNYFDLIFSNQVMEHVFNQQFLLSEIRRTMVTDGYSFHLYPLRHYIYEGHLEVPFVHKFYSWSSTYFWIKWGNMLGFGTFKRHKKAGLATSLNEYAERHADYMAFQVNYQTLKQISATAKECRLKSSFDFTHFYYKQKLRSLFRLSQMEDYGRHSLRSSRSGFYFFFLKYISGITLMLRKNDTF